MEVGVSSLGLHELGLAIVLDLSLFGDFLCRWPLWFHVLSFSISPWVRLLVSVCVLAGALNLHYVIVSLLHFAENTLFVFYTPTALCVLSHKRYCCICLEHLMSLRLPALVCALWINLTVSSVVVSYWVWLCSLLCMIITGVFAGFTWITVSLLLDIMFCRHITTVFSQTKFMQPHGGYPHLHTAENFLCLNIFSMFINFSMSTNNLCSRNSMVRGLM